MATVDAKPGTRRVVVDDDGLVPVVRAPLRAVASRSRRALNPDASYRNNRISPARKGTPTRVGSRVVRPSSPPPPRRRLACRRIARSSWTRACVSRARSARRGRRRTRRRRNAGCARLR
eukprot:31356-Pelagococcus_subviridis.AAC.2